MDNGFWLAQDLYDDSYIFINAAHVIAVKPFMEDDVVTGYSVHMIDGREFEVKFHTGPFISHKFW